MVFEPACVCHQTTGEMLIRHREPRQRALNVFYCSKETDAESISKSGLLNERELKTRAEPFRQQQRPPEEWGSLESLLHGRWNDPEGPSAVDANLIFCG